MIPIDSVPQMMLNPNKFITSHLQAYYRPAVSEDGDLLIDFSGKDKHGSITPSSSFSTLSFDSIQNFYLSDYLFKWKSTSAGLLSTINSMNFLTDEGQQIILSITDSVLNIEYTDTIKISISLSVGYNKIKLYPPRVCPAHLGTKS